MLAKSMLHRGMVLGLTSGRGCRVSEVRRIDWSSLGSGIAAPVTAGIVSPILRGFHTSLEVEAARKGTRARKEKGKVKKEDTKKPYLLRRLHKEAEMGYKKLRPFDKSHYPQAIDDVYFYRKYQHKEWDFAEAVQNHREVHDPSVYNVPDVPLMLRIDMDFRYPKRPQKCMDKWRAIIEMSEPFLLPGMVLPTVLAICPPNQNELEAASLEAGADMAGSTEIIKSIQTGEIHSGDFEYIVCHPLVITEISVLRGLCKKNFPSTRTRTIDADLPAAIRRLKGGLKIAVNCSDREPDYGYIEVPIGSLNMETAALQRNFEAVFQDTVGRRVAGKTPEEFILQCVLKTSRSFEEFKLNITEHIVKHAYLKRGGKGKQVEEEAEVADDEAPEQEKQAAVV